MAHKKAVTGVAAFFLVAVLLVGYSTIAAEIGGKTDPLVTLSYLEGLNPDFEKTVEEIVSGKTEERFKSIDSQIDKLSRDLLDLQSAGGADLSQLVDDPNFIAAVAAHVEAPVQAAPDTGGSDGSLLQKVEVEGGKSVELEMGSLLLLRLGEAKCMAPGDPGLIDLTDGTTLSAGSTVAPNHLYTVTVVGGRGFTTTDNVVVFIMGNYTIT